MESFGALGPVAVERCLVENIAFLGRISESRPGLARLVIGVFHGLEIPEFWTCSMLAHRY